MNTKRTLIPNLIALLCMLAVAAPAANLNWSGNGGDANWSTGANWAGTAPVNGDNLIFSAQMQTGNNNDLTGLSAGWVLFDGYGFSLTGNPVTLGGGITNTLSASGATLGMNVILSASQTFQSDGGTLAFLNAISNDVNNVTVTGSGDVSWNNNSTNGMMGSGNLIFNGPGTMTVGGGWLYGLPTRNFPGNTIVNGGTLTFAVGTFDGNSPMGQSLTINPGATVTTIQPHMAGSSGRPVSIYGGTLNMSKEAYFTTIVLSNATVNGPSDVRGNGAFANLASAAGTVFAAPLTLTSSRTISVDEGTADPDIDFQGGVGNAGSLTKVGAGKMVISGAGKYTGTTLISAGTLALTGSGTIENSPSITVATNSVFDISGVSFSLNTNQILAGIGKVLGTLYDYNIATGEVLSPGGNGVAGTLTLEGLNLSGNVALSFDLSTTASVIGGGTNDLLIVTNLTLSTYATNMVNLTALGGSLAQGVPYTLIKYSSCSAAAGAITTLAAPPSHFVYSFANDTANSRITVTVTGNPYNLTWKGDGVTNTWDITTTPNWLVNGVTPDVFYDGDNTTFTDSGSVNPAVNVTTTVKPTTVTVNATKDYTVGGAGKISGGAKLIKSNSGNLTLLTDNDFAGGGSLNGSGVVNVGTGSSSGNLGAGNLTNNTRVSFNRLGSSATYAGNMSGTGSLLVNMYAATLSLTGSNSFTGGLNVFQGTAQIGASPTVAGARISGPITNYTSLYFSCTDAFTNQSLITSAGDPLTYGNGDLNIRGTGGMNVDGTAPISLLGSISIGQSLYGKLTLYPGAAVSAVGNLLLGNPNGAANNGDVIQNGGTLSISNQVRVGHWSTEVSTYTMNSGTLNVPNNNLAVGWDGIGLFYMNGGTVNARTLNIDDNGATTAISGTNSTFTMVGGQLNIGSGGIGGNTATIKLSGGTIAAVAPAGFSSAMAMILTNGSPTIDSSNSLITLSGVLSGDGGLTKRGTGYLSLNGVNTYTGATVVATGTLQGSGTVVGPVTVQSGAALSAGGTLATGTLTLSNLTANPGAGLVFDLSSTAATSDLLTVKGALTLDAATPATFNFLGGTPFTGGPYTIVTNWLGRSGALSYANTTRYTPVFDYSNPNRIQVSFTGTNANLVWRGDVNSLWNVNADANWRNAGVPDKYSQSDVVVFDGSSSVTNVTLAAAMTPVSITVNSSQNYKFSGAPITGIATLTKSGSGKLTLENDYTSTGGVTVSAGTLQIGNGGTTGSVTGIGNLNAANIADYGSVVFNRSDTINYSGVISGPGSLTQAGSGKLVILATQNHYGGTTINPGSTVQLGNGPLFDVGSLGSSPANNNGTVIFYRANNIAVATPYTGAGSLIFQGTGVSGQGGYSLNATNSFTGPVTLNLARIQSGAGALSFGNPSSITVNPGSEVYAVAVPYSSVFNTPLTLAGSGWFDGLGALRIENGGTWAGNLTLASNARIAVNNATTNTITGTISGAGKELDVYNANSGLLILAPSSPNTFASLRVSGTTAGATVIGNANGVPNNIALSLNSGALRLNGIDRSFSPYSPGGGQIQNGSATNPASVTLAPPVGATTYTPTFADGGSQPLHVTFTQPAGTFAITLANSSATWTGNFTNNGGTITVSSGTGLLGAANVPTRTLVFNNSTFNLSPNNAWSGGGASATMILINSTLNCTRYNSFGPFVLNGSTLTGANSADPVYYASYNLTGGKVTVTGSAPSFMTGSGSSYGFNLQDNTVFDVADVTSSSAVDLTVSAPLRAGGAIGSTGSLIKTGAGKMLVNDVATYTGPTIVSNGVLVIGASGSIATTSSIKVNSGATLDVTDVGGLTLGAQTLSGSGTVIGTVSDGATSVIAPGSSVGTLTVGGLTLNGAGGTLAFELNSTATTTGAGVNDLIQVNGALSLNDSTPTPVNFTFLNGPNAAGTYTIMNYSGALSGTAAGFTNTQGYPVTFTVGGGVVRATFAAAAAQSLVWQGDGSANAWDLVTTSTNWYNGSADTNFFQLDNVRFNDTRTTVNTTVDVVAQVAPASITFDSANDYTFKGAGKITGVTTTTKNNTNTVTLGVVNDAVGPISVNAGMLKFNGDVDNSYVGLTTATVASGGAFNFGGSYDTVQSRTHNFLIAGAGPDGQGALRNDLYPVYSYTYISNITLTADAVLGSEQRWDIGPTANSTVNGQGYKLTKVGSGSIDMRAQLITNVASITVSNGYWFYENYDQTNAWTATTTNYIKPGASLGNYGGRQIGMPVVLDGATIQSEGGGTPNWVGPIQLDSGSLFRNNAAQWFNGVISGPGVMWVNGGRATLAFSNANTYAGGTILSNGPATTISAATAGNSALIAANPGAFGAGALTINGTDFSSLTTNASFFATNVFRAVEFAFAAPGTVINQINLPTGTITNVSIQGRDSTQRINLAGKISGGVAGLTNWVDFGDSGSAGVMRWGSVANDFVGNIYVDRGVLAITADGSLGNSANSLKLDQASANGGLRFDASGITVAHATILNSATTLRVYGDNNGDGIPETANNASISGVVSGAGATTVLGGTNVSGTSSGSLTLSGNNTFTAALAVNADTKLIATHANALGTTAGATTVNLGGTLSLNLNGTYAAEPLTLNGAGVQVGGIGIGALENASGANTINGNITLGSPSIIGVTAGSLSLGGVISGNFQLTKIGTGTLTLNGANTYNAGTLVNAGTLFVNGSLPAGNAVSVTSGAILGGVGTLNGPVTVQGGAFLAPGVNAVGRLTINSTLVLAGTTSMELNKATGTNDSVVGLSEVTYGGSLVVNNLNGTLALGDTFKLFGATAYSGSFSSMTLPSLPGGYFWDTSRLAVDGTIKVSTAILSAPVRLPDGNFSLAFSGPEGQSYRIWATTNVALTPIITTWTQVGAGTFGPLPALFTDLNATNYMDRFYAISIP